MLDPCAISWLVKKFVCSLGVLLCRITQTGLIFPHQSMSLADILDYIKTAGFGVFQSSCEIQVSEFHAVFDGGFFLSLIDFGGHLTSWPLLLLQSGFTAATKKSHLSVI